MKCSSIFDLPAKGRWTRRRLAVHEAGHAAMALWLGGYVLGAGIGPDNKGHGLAYANGGFLRDTEERDLLYTLAGNSSERRYRNEPQKLHLTKGDFKLLRKNIGENYAGDGEHAFMTLTKGKKRRSDFEVELLFSEYAIRCGSIVSNPSFWKAVLAISDALVSKGQLRESEINQLFNRAVA